MTGSFHELLATSDLFLLPARHHLRPDTPATVASLLKSVPLKPIASRATRALTASAS